MFIILRVVAKNSDQLQNMSFKDILDAAINKSSYFLENSNNQRPLQIPWKLAKKIDLGMIKLACPHGYANFTKSLLLAAKSVIPIINK